MNIDALKSRSFRIYLFGNVFAVNAFWIQRTTIAWIAWDLTQSASFVGFVAFMFFVPTMVTGPLFGVLIDRVNVAAAGFATQGTLMVLTLITLILELNGLLGPLALILLTGVSGIATSMHHPVRLSLAPRLVPRGALASVVTFAALNFNTARITGPALGGWAIAEKGVAFALVVQAFLFLPYLAAMPLLQVRSGRSADRALDPFLTALTWGFRYVFRSRSVLRAMILSGILSFAVHGVLETLPVLADGAFSRGAQGLGVLMASAGVGAISAAFLMTLLPPQGSRLPGAALAVSWLGVALIPVLGFVSVWELAMLIVAALGFSATVTGIVVQTVIQSHLEDDARGRVMSLWVMVGIGSSAAGAMLLGLGVDLFGLQAALLWGGGFMALLFGLFALRPA